MSRQRVALILQPGDVWVIEKGLSFEEKGVEEALRTCHLRGWVEAVRDAAPHGSVDSQAQIKYPQRVAPIYRLTEAGWAVLNRTHEWVIRTFLVATSALIVAVLAWAFP